MSYITTRYRSSMHLYRDRPDIVTHGRWHWCPPGAVAIPYLHAFGSFSSDPGPFPLHPPVGEIPRKRGHVRGGEDPRYVGKNWCGSADVWQNGALYSQRGTPPVDADGVPLCCLSAPGDPGGGDCNYGAIWGPVDTSAPVPLLADVRQIPAGPVILVPQIPARLNVLLVESGPVVPVSQIPPKIDMRVRALTPTTPLVPVPLLADVRLVPAPPTTPLVPVPLLADVRAHVVPPVLYPAPVPLLADIRLVPQPPVLPVAIVAVKIQVDGGWPGPGTVNVPVPAKLDIGVQLVGPILYVPQIPEKLDINVQLKQPKLYVPQVPLRVNHKIRAYTHAVYVPEIPVKLDIRLVLGPPAPPHDPQVIAPCIGWPVRSQLKAFVTIVAGGPADIGTVYNLVYNPFDTIWAYEGLTPGGWRLVVQMGCGLPSTGGVLSASIVSTRCNNYQPLPASSVVIGPPFTAIFGPFTQFNCAADPSVSLQLTVTG